MLLVVFYISIYWIKNVKLFFSCLFFLVNKIQGKKINIFLSVNWSQVNKKENNDSDFPLHVFCYYIHLFLLDFFCIYLLRLNKNSRTIYRNLKGWNLNILCFVWWRFKERFIDRACFCMHMLASKESSICECNKTHVFFFLSRSHSPFFAVPTKKQAPFRGLSVCQSS